MKKKFITFILLITFHLGIFASQQENKEFALLGSGEYFQLSPVTDSILLGGSLSLITTNFILEYFTSIDDNSINTFDFDKSKIPLIDQTFMTHYSKPLSLVSYGTMFACLASPAIFCTLPSSEWFTLAAMYTETLLWAYGLKDFGKTLIARARPYMYFDDIPEEKVKESDWNDSWPSGHTTAAFSAAMFSSYVFCNYYPENNLKIPVIIGSFSFATATAALRMASGSHFFTDVITGAIIGSFSGFFIPWVHKTQKSNSDSDKISITPIPSGINVKMSF